MVRQGGEDSIWSIPSKRQKFEVESFYQAISIPTSSTFPYNSLCFLFSYIKCYFWQKKHEHRKEQHQNEAIPNPAKVNSKQAK